MTNRTPHQISLFDHVSAQSTEAEDKARRRAARRRARHVIAERETAKTMPWDEAERASARMLVTNAASWPPEPEEERETLRATFASPLTRNGGTASSTMPRSGSARSRMSSIRSDRRAGAVVRAPAPDPANRSPLAPPERFRLPRVCRRVVAASLVLLFCGIGGGSATSSAAQPAAPSAFASGTDAAEAPLDVCALFPRAVMERALGRIERTRSLNITRADAPMRTPGGSGGCLWEGQGWRQVRLEVHTAAGLARQGLGSPRRYIDLGWPIGPDAAAVEGLGEVARLRPATGGSIELVAGSADRAVHLMAEGLARDQAVAIVRAALEQMRLR